MAKPTFTLEWSPTTQPRATPAWVDVSSRLMWFELERGRQNEYDRNETARLRLRLKNDDRAFDAKYTAGPWYGNVKVMRRWRFSMTIAAVTHRLFSGYMEDLPRKRPRGTRWAEVEILLVDGFEPLSSAPLVGTFASGLTGARINAALDAAGHPAGERSIDAGQDTVPAVTFAAADQQKALDHIQYIGEDTEMGSFFMRGDGYAIFRDRHSLLKSPYSVSQATFSDQPTGSELPYRNIVPVNEVRKVVNDWTVTPDGGAGVPQQSIDAASDLDYLPRADSKIIAVTSASTAKAQSEYRLSRTKDPLQRYESLELRPGDRTDIWQQVLGRDLGDRITVKETPPGGGSANVEDAHIQHIRIESGRELADATCWWNLYSSDLAAYLIFDDVVQGAMDSNKMAY